MGQLIRVNFRKEPTIRDRSIAIRYVSDAYKLELIEVYDEAVELLHKALRLNPYCFQAVYALGEISFKRNNFKEARAFYHEAMALNPDNAGPPFKLGMLEVVDNAFDSAVDYFQQALTADASYSEAHYKIAEISQYTGNLEVAIKHWNAYLKTGHNQEQLEIARSCQRQCLDKLLRTF